MLVGIIGPVCSGKWQAAHYLVQHEGFRLLDTIVPHSNTATGANTSTDKGKETKCIEDLIRTSFWQKGNDAVVVFDPPSVSRNCMNLTKRKQAQAQSSSEKGVCLDQEQELQDNNGAGGLRPAVSYEILKELLKRPYFLLIYIDAPIAIRHQRYRQVYDAKVSMEEFVFMDQKDAFDSLPMLENGYVPHPDPENMVAQLADSLSTHVISHQPENSNPPAAGSTSMASTSCEDGSSSALSLFCLQQRAHIRLLNRYPSIEPLGNHLQRLEIRNTERLRPSWDLYFLRLAELASARTNCMKRRVGAVIVRENRVVSTGYNGTPKRCLNCNEGGCQRCNSFTSAGLGLYDCLCCHAEENAIIEAGRDRCRGSTVYTNLFPCLSCTKKIIQAEIVRVVFATSYTADEGCLSLFQQAGVSVDHVHLI